MNKNQFEHIETPALVLHERKLRQNLNRMMKVSKNQVEVRPHFKTHKSLMIAELQVEMGAVGITVATSTEAELLLKHGFKSILLAFPLSDRKKISRLLHRTQVGELIFTIDSKEQATIVIEECKKAGVEAEVWIKVNCGLNRCGVEPEEESLQLAKYIGTHSSLKLTGIFTHAGHSYGATSQEAIQRIAGEEAKSVVKSAELCEKEGIPIQHRSVGSTPTFESAATYSGITEVRPGNAVFFDGIQVSLGVAEPEEVALTVMSTVSSIKTNRFILDAGSKALTTEKGAHGNEGIKGFGMLYHEGLNVTRVSEEHGIVDVDNDSEEPGELKMKLNQKVMIIPNHACPVVNLFDHYHYVKDNGAIVKLPVDGRGMSQ